MGKIAKMGELRESFLEAFKGSGKRIEFVPSGIQDEVIEAFGSGRWEYITDEKPNKVGKTYGAAAILRALMWPDDYADQYFPDKLYRDWQYPKRILIGGTKRNTADTGPIREAIKALWPADRYNDSKEGMHYYQQYETDTGWIVHVLSYHIAPDEWEGDLYGAVWLDEPAPAHVIGAVASRLGLGGVILHTMTPINAGPTISELDDIKERGAAVKHITCGVLEDAAEDGRPNRLGTKRGNRPKSVIEKWERTIPLGQRKARVDGQRSGNTGRLHDFVHNVHVRDLPLESLAEANHYMGFDPARKYYPFASWWAVTPSGRVICYNEWPTFETLGCYYDEARFSEICPYGIDSLAEIFKASDIFEIDRRIIDPYFSSITKDEHQLTRAKEASSLIQKYAESGLTFDPAPRERISVQQENIDKLLLYNKDIGISAWNDADLLVMPHCRNVARSLSRMSWAYDENGKTDKVDEKYKDPWDTLRYILAAVGFPIQYSPPSSTRKSAPRVSPRNAPVSLSSVECG